MDRLLESRFDQLLRRHAEHATDAALVRPDFYVFGSTCSPEQLPALLDDLQQVFDFHALLAGD